MEDYLHAAIPEIKHIKPFGHGGSKIGFVTKRYVGPQRIDTVTHIEGFHPGTTQGNFKLMGLAPNSLPQPNQIISTYSKGQDISMGSHGGRTTNFYYRVDPKNTLHVSIKWFSFKRERAMKIWPLSIAWKKIKRTAISSTLSGTARSLRSIQKFLSNRVRESQ